MNINSSKAFNASQIEFFSQDEYISIIPNENIPVIHLMTVRLFFFWLKSKNNSKTTNPPYKDKRTYLFF